MFTIYPLWYMFTLPGRYKLWKNYYFPSNVNQSFAAERQYQSSFIMFLYSLKFWGFWIFLSATLPGLLLLILSYAVNSPDNLPVPQPLLLWYINTEHYWLAQKSAAFDLNFWRTGVNLCKNILLIVKAYTK